MDEYFSILKEMSLFSGTTAEDLSHIMHCLEAFQKTYDKNEVIIQYFEQIPYAGIVLEGEVHAVMHTAAGNEYGARRFTVGDLFGEAYSCVPDEHSVIQAVAQKKSRILFLKFANLFKPQARTCPHASKVTANLLQETARNNIFQNKKILILTQKHIRDRLNTYLSSLPPQPDGSRLVPFDRQGLANYLGVERSALSRELSRMKLEGLLDYDKNRFVLREAAGDH